jgi:hypothetical protein
MMTLGVDTRNQLSNALVALFCNVSQRIPKLILQTDTGLVAEADFESQPEEQRRFAILNISGHLFSEATGESARRAPRKAMMLRLSDHKID